MIVVVGVNHDTAPVAVREALAFASDALPAALARVREDAGLAEAVILSTCNRVEVYGRAIGAAPLDAMAAFLALAAVGVDLGRLAFTATEVQTVADVAATAGARTLLLNSVTGTSSNAVTAAQLAAAQNQIDGRAATVAAGSTYASDGMA